MGNAVMKFYSAVLLALTMLPLTAIADEPAAIRLQEIEGRTWLVSPNGGPFFAHGVTHVGNGRQVGLPALARALRELGFNAYGYGCPNELKSDLPYMEGRNYLPTSMYRTSDKSFTFVDIFDPAVQAEQDAAVRRTCYANRNNPNLIGYYWTDLTPWPLENNTGTNWVEYIRSLSADAPGQQAYQKFLADWDGNDETARDTAFLRLIAREYCRVFGEAHRKYDPDHLVFGDRFMPQFAIPEVLEEMVPYVDAIAIQPHFRPGFPKKELDRIHELTGKPIVLCDFAIRFEDGDKNIRGYKPEESPQKAGELYAEYIRDAMATPYVIGSFWCNPLDSKPGFNKTGIKQGLFDNDFTPRPSLNKQMQQLNAWIDQQKPSK